MFADALTSYNRKGEKSDIPANRRRQWEWPATARPVNRRSPEVLAALSGPANDPQRQLHSRVDWIVDSPTLAAGVRALN